MHTDQVTKINWWFTPLWNRVFLFIVIFIWIAVFLFLMFSLDDSVFLPHLLLLAVFILSMIVNACRFTLRFSLELTLNEISRRSFLGVQKFKIYLPPNTRVEKSSVGKYLTYQIKLLDGDWLSLFYFKKNKASEKLQNKLEKALNI